MIQLKNKKTGAPYEVSEESWEKMKQNGDSRKYDNLSASTSKGKVAMPAESGGADYDGLLKAATKLFKEGKWQQAKDKFLAVKAIKETQYTIDRLAAIEMKLNAKAEDETESNN